MVIEQAINRYRGLAALGIPLAGLTWSIGTWFVHQQEIMATGLGITESLFLVALGGLSQMLALWVGFSAVAWAMVRAFGGRIGLFNTLVLTSSSAVPLWLGAPVAVIALQADQGENLLAIFIAILCGVMFVFLASLKLASALSWSVTRAVLALFATVVFLASFVSLTI